MNRTCDHCLKPYVAKRRHGRFCSPTCRVAASRNKAVPIETAPIDLSTVDPRAVLREIAGNPLASAAARVSACRLLIADAPKAADTKQTREEKALALLNERTMEIMARRVH
jgi:hypothetical protein